MFDDSGVMFLRLILAALLCGVIGIEREVKRHPAGFRTHLLVGVGACLMMLLSLFGFSQFLEENQHVQYDPARIPSYVISGIGFLGAGTILVKGATVKGLTTAASIWVVAGIGLVIGAGMYDLAAFSTAVVLLSLIFLNKMDPVLKGSHDRIIKAVFFDGELGEFVQKLEEMDVLVDRVYLLNIKSKTGKKQFQYVIRAKGAGNSATFMEEIKKVNGVQKVF
ncbi:MgtC/SapB family protein [Bacillus kexueae]|uniref:MgtC/SapB family protein n=1 Tax=Aeribacillus kexueae TaxID=2078952 RepID=UPI001FAFE836|nr:MgtC/SapB family protein [Bacillus kexueae]